MTNPFALVCWEAQFGDFNNTAQVNICYSPAGRSVLGKTVPEVSSPVLETEGTVFPNTNRPRPVNNIFIYF